MMEGIGAIRIFWESTPVEDASSLKFIMVTTTMGHVRAQIYCGSKSYCNNLRQIKVELPEANASPDISEGSTTAMMGFRLSPPSSTIESPGTKLRCIMTRFNGQASDCRSCLEQTSSDLFAQFPVFFDGLSFVVYVMSSLEDKQSLCFQKKLCPEFKGWEYPPELCEHIHKTGVAKHLRTGNTVGGKAEVTEISVKARKPSVEKEELRCIKMQSADANKVLIPFNDEDETRKCIHCMTRNDKKILHWMNSNAAPSEYVLLLFPTTNQDGCEKFCQNAKSVDTRECYQNYYAHFEMSSIEDQLFAYPPQLTANHISNHDSKCVVVHSRDNLKTCIDSLKSGYDNSKYSELSENIALLATEETQSWAGLEIAECTKLQTVHNEVCVHDFKTAIISSERASALLIHVPTGGSHSRGDGFKHDVPSIKTSLTVSIVKAPFESYHCSYCWALRYEVLVMSFTKAYVWMVEPPDGGSRCDCQLNVEATIENFKLISPRLISGFKASGRIQNLMYRNESSDTD